MALTILIDFPQTIFYFPSHKLIDYILPIKT